MERNDARSAVDALTAQASDGEQAQHRLARLEAAARSGVSLEQLDAAEALVGATTAADILAAGERLARVTTQQQLATSRNPAPPRQPTAPPTTDEQIIAAQNDGNYRETMRLKAEQLTNE